MVSTKSRLRAVFRRFYFHLNFGGSGFAENRMKKRKFSFSLSENAKNALILCAKFFCYVLAVIFEDYLLRAVIFYAECEDN